MDASRHTYKVYHQDFTIDSQLTLTRELGRGAYGIVCSASCPSSPGVAIKKITNIFSKEILRRRALREIKMLIHFRGHKNITCLYDLDIVRPDFNEVYLYEDLMECDLHVIIRSGQPLTDYHYQSFVYQILCGLKYIHSANVLHRDLKPGNLLVNADCELKICDFGLARGPKSHDYDVLTEYVATRWYRAPEIMLSASSYSKAIDIWSVGCILAELLSGKPFFKGENPFDQINQIISVMGTPAPDTLTSVSPKIQEYLSSLNYQAPVPLDSIFPTANPEALNLLAKLLEFNPEHRISVLEALEHPYLRVWHDPADEPECPSEFDFSFEAITDADEMRKEILNTVQMFRSFVREQPQTTYMNPREPAPESNSQYYDYDPEATPTVPRAW